MTPYEFWQKAATWGSYRHSGDLGACLFGFDERGEVRDEEHRTACVLYLDVSCRQSAKANDAQQDALVSPAEKEIDALIAYVKTAPRARRK